MQMAARYVHAVASLSLAVVGQARLLRSGRGGGIFSLYSGVFSAPECTCNCCIVEGRRPSETVGAITTKCAVPPLNDKRNELYKCPTACSIVNDAIIGSTNVVHVERYCFYHCQPATNERPDQKIINEDSDEASFNGGSLTDSTCVPIPPSLLANATSSDLNGKDSKAPAASTFSAAAGAASSAASSVAPAAATSGNATVAPAGNATKS